MKQFAIFYTLHEANESIISVLNISEEIILGFGVFCLGWFVTFPHQFHCCTLNVDFSHFHRTVELHGKVTLSPKGEKNPTPFW